MDIAHTIKRLIIANDKVYIFETGTLVTKYKPSEIQPSGEITPPTKEIIFDEKGEKDNLLKETLLKEGLDEKQADEELKKLAHGIKEAIKKGEKYELEGLGYFTLDKNKKITFVTTTKDSLLPETIGFEPVKAGVVNHKTTSDSKKTTEKKTHDKKPAKVTKTTKSVRKQEPQTTKSSKVTIQRKKKSALRWIAPLLLLFVVVAGIVYFYTPLKDKITSMVGNDDSKHVIDSVINKPIETDTVNFQIDPEYKKLLDAHIGSMQNVYLGDNYKKFYIIVGSFIDKKNAKQLQKQMKNMGYQSSILYVEGQDYYRVAIGSYNTADTVIDEFKKYTAKYGEDIWILVNKK